MSRDPQRPSPVRRVRIGQTAEPEQSVPQEPESEYEPDYEPDYEYEYEPEPMPRAPRYSGRPRGEGAYYQYEAAPPRAEIAPYLIGGLVSAAIALILVIVWIVAVPNNPLTGNGNAPIAVVNNNSGSNNSNNINPFDVPTDVNPIQADGTSYPTIPPALPTGSPGPASYLYLPQSLGILDSRVPTGRGFSVSAHGLRHIVDTIE